MKKFFTAIPLQGPGQLHSNVYQAVGNQKLQLDQAVSFPILTAVNGYAEPDEEIRVIAVATDNADARRNLGILQSELKALCETKGVRCPKGVETVFEPEDDRVETHISTFQKLIDFVDDDDELFLCMTYGTKPISQVMMMAVQYAYRIKRNTSISCVVYGGVIRHENKVVGSRAYDMTALVQMDEIVRMLAEQGVSNPQKVINSILNL